MKLVIQVVDRAKVEVDSRITGQIGKGYLVLVGVGQDDTKSDVEVLAKKLIGLRIFEDSNGKTNLSLADIDGEILSVSQFTLYADCSHGRRPSFIYAGAPDLANELYEYFNEVLESLYPKPVQKGIFGADMKVSLVNNGPFTIILDSKDFKK
ncbi:MAG: D-tyrosyl-tRNA(Tyr) deacylase [Clostridia bacterium]|nr:D-tyrosyl-tRNA(Tyr) deacylase [Clostridia bacterium]